MLPIFKVRNVCVVSVQAEAGRSRAIIPALMSRKTEVARSVRIAPSQSMPSRDCRFAGNAATELFLDEIESSA
jgi:hypothetical protein